MFEIFLTDKAKAQLSELKTDKGLAKRYKALIKTIRFLASNPRHQSLNTHEFKSLGQRVKNFLRRMQNNPHPQHTEFSGITDRQRIR